MSGWFDSFNQAVGFTRDPNGNQGSNIEQLLREAQQLEDQKRLQDQARADTAPYRIAGAIGAGLLNDYLLGGYDPKKDPNYRYALNEMNTNMTRQLRDGLRRSNSTYGMNALAKATGDLAIKTGDNWWNKLMGATNVGQGTASTSNGALNNAAALSNSLYNTQLQQGNLNAFNSQQARYNNMASGVNALGLGAKLYDYGKQSGWWGGNNDAGFNTAYDANTNFDYNGNTIDNGGWENM